MIKRITRIKDFGVFKDYRRSGDIQDFAKVNIIYGWNYSGKTTISRIFQSLESQRIDPNYSTAEFEIEDYTGNKFNQNKLTQSDYEFRVFNSDFIRDNIHLEGEPFDPVLLLGKESKEAAEQIKLKNEELAKVQKVIKRQNKLAGNIENEFSQGLTRIAAETKQNLGIVEAYNKGHIEREELPIVYRHVMYHQPTRFTLSRGDQERYLIWAKSSDNDKLPEINEYKPKTTLDVSLENAQELLNQIPEFSKTIGYLMDNPGVSTWVESGMDINAGKDHCEFCLNPIGKERQTELLAHFSEDLKKHKQDLLALKTSIDESKLQTPEVQKSDFYKDLWDDFERVFGILQEEVLKYNKEIDKLSNLIQTKFDSPFKTITDFSSINIDVSSINESTTSYNELVSTHNKKTEEFEQNKKNAIDALKKHYISLFLNEFKPWPKDEYVMFHNQLREAFEDRQIQLMTDIAELEASISKAQVGAEELNVFIEKFLGRKEINVAVVNVDGHERFILVRGEKKAVNLSEGEKTAIAFSFFLTKLKECGDLTNVVVYIDDPISSLDSNHIFQVNALLKDFFFLKNDENSPWTLNVKQLFISTHNFDFFNLIRELPRKSKAVGINDLKHQYYHVARVEEEESAIKKLPDSLLRYKSEYHFLFEEIFKFHNSPKESKSEYKTLMYVPNAVRRFTELYTYSRIPGTKETTVDQRADQLWGIEKSKRILKVYNYFSHSNNIEGMIGQSDLMCNIEGAVADLLGLISETDALHYKELEKAVQS